MAIYVTPEFSFVLPSIDMLWFSFCQPLLKCQVTLGLFDCLFLHFVFIMFIFQKLKPTSLHLVVIQKKSSINTIWNSQLSHRMIWSEKVVLILLLLAMLKISYCNLQDRYRQDCNVAVQLLRCRPSNFIPHKLTSVRRCVFFKEICSWISLRDLC